MSYSQLMSSYLGVGPLADRPSAPNVAPGVSACYYATDTSLLYVWTGTAWAPARGSTPYLYLPAAWDAGWKQSKSRASTQPVWMAAIGDSITQGVGSSDYLTNGWLARVRSSLLADNGLYADFYPTVDSAAFTGAAGLPWSMAQTPSYYPGGLLQWPYWSQTGITPATFTSPAACTAMDIIWGDVNVSFPGTWQYRVDGGPWQTVTTSAAAYETKRISISGLSDTIHTVDFGNQNPAPTMYLVGVCTYTGSASGLGFVRMAAAGQDMNTLMDTTFGYYPVDRIRLWAGVEPQGNAAQTAATGFGFPTQPHLALIALGVNDCNLGKSSSNYKTGLIRFINAIRRGQPNASIILIAPSYPDATHSDLTSGTWNNPLVWPDYLTIMREVSEAYNCAFINVHAKWGDYGATNGYQSATDPHPTDQGHTDIAALVSSIL